jgi:hypothetical protein
MSNIYDEQLDRMKTLMSYGINEATARESQSVVEYKAEGADGKTYGIIREGQKFYIKAAPKKDTEVIAEDFDYIGGFMNKKNYEYLTYPMASKQLELKLMSVNEACNTKKPVLTEGIKNEAAEWQVNETKEMRAELDRFAEIVNNVDHILKEDKDGGFTMNHTLPEAPAKNPSDKKVNAPFTDTAVAKLDKDLKETETNPEKAGGPYTEDGEVSNKEMQSDKTPGNGADDGTYCEKPQYVDTGVAGEHPKGGKVVRVESKGHTVKLTEAQVLAWNKSKDFMDKTNGTNIGSSAPYTDQVDSNQSNQGESDAEPIHEDANVVHNTDNQNSPTPGTNKIGDSAPFTDKVNEEVVDVNDVAGMGDDVPFPEVEGDDNGSYLNFEQNYNDWLDSQEPESITLDNDNPIDGGDDYEEELDPSLIDIGEVPYESINRIVKQVTESVLNDFGKHPAYQKKPMTTPPNTEIDKFGKDWNDDSAKGEKPFGTQIGSSAPFTDEVIEQLTDSIMKRINQGKKKD